MAAPAELSGFLARSRHPRRHGDIAAILSRCSTRSFFQVAALGEMVVDKLPAIPDRIEAEPLLARALFGALTGGILAERLDESGALGAIVGAAAAVLSAHAGFHARRALAHSAGLPDLPVALCEDAASIALARHALHGLAERSA